jgi:cellulose synthase/poly-beta-1,6-N-acetylglucosamine synthase-like glycosyltransferase
MIQVASLIVALLALALAIAWVIYSLEVAIGLAPRRSTRELAPDDSVVVLIPAHNEGDGIAQTIAKLRQVAEGARILVVADNCSDDTAQIAAAAGAMVAARADLSRKGKGFALDHGRTLLLADPPSVVIVLDADCELTAGSVRQLASVASTGRPAQAVNTLLPDLSAHPLVQISSFAFLIKNKVRGLGLARIGRTTALTGTGMAFPWSIFSKAPLATADIVEDLALGIELTRQGYCPQIVEGAFVLSKASDVAQSRVQRTRWEHGFLKTIFSKGLPLFAEAIRRRSRALLALSLHLLVPPLALLVALSVVISALAFGLALHTNAWTTLVFLVIAMGLGLFLTLVAWGVHGRSTLRLTALLGIPFYVLWKIPLYVRFFSARETNWRRTPRSGESK